MMVGMPRYGVLLAAVALAAVVPTVGACSAPSTPAATSTSTSPSPPTQPTSTPAPPTTTSAPPTTTSTPTTTPTKTTAATVPPAPPATIGPPYIASVRWLRTSSGRSLHISPTQAGRDTAASSDEAWGEVLRLAPDAATPGMRAQFDCHWTFARLVAPAKRTWNIEPWRPVVSPERLVQDRCNPGGGTEG